MILVFDAEPLVAFLAGEDGGDATKKLLLRVRGGLDEGWASTVTLCEVRCVLKRRPALPVDTLLASLAAEGLREASADAIWRAAAEMKTKHKLGLGDTYSFTTARVKQAALVVRADADFDDPAKAERVKLEKVG